MLRFHNRNQVQNTVFKKKFFLYTSKLGRLGAKKTEKIQFWKKSDGFEEILDIIEAQRFFIFLKTVDFGVRRAQIQDPGSSPKFALFLGGGHFS